MRRLFADTYFYLAMLNPRDAGHRRAMKMFEAGGVGEIVTTTAVLMEMADGMARIGERMRLIRFVDRLRSDSRTRLVETDAARYWRGFDLYRSRPDKEWSLTDCISFVVMAEEGIAEALTGDHHFEQAGFVALLK
ncbi:MAG TPA: PIN domain-containing protein [Chthoniobacteraceae bacterium]|jgi:predicted nucleic acid-binding protein|nr:PIN domain-containing protein [Chthoniobacteraceae bacterium]